jgi:hypothetical protein
VKAQHQRQLEMTIQTTPDYSTVSQFVEQNPAFNTGGLRALIFNEHQNGLAQSGSIIRIGRKVLINTDKFYAWIESQNKAA